jgi:hypothetical protein
MWIRTTSATPGLAVGTFAWRVWPQHITGNIFFEAGPRTSRPCYAEAILKCCCTCVARSPCWSANWAFPGERVGESCKRANGWEGL